MTMPHHDPDLTCQPDAVMTESGEHDVEDGDLMTTLSMSRRVLQSVRLDPSSCRDFKVLFASRNSPPERRIRSLPKSVSQENIKAW